MLSPLSHRKHLFKCGYIRIILKGFLSTSYSVQSLHLCVNLIGLKEVQTAGKTLFLGVYVRIFLEEINI